MNRRGILKALLSTPFAAWLAPKAAQASAPYMESPDTIVFPKPGTYSINIEHWDTSQTIDFSKTFSGCAPLKNTDFDVSDVPTAREAMPEFDWDALEAGGDPRKLAADMMRRVENKKFLARAEAKMNRTVYKEDPDFREMLTLVRGDTSGIQAGPTKAECEAHEAQEPREARFETSIGWVNGKVIPSVHTLRVKQNGFTTTFPVTLGYFFEEGEAGAAVLDELYDYSGIGIDGDWVEIYLSDGHYGSPEYKLEYLSEWTITDGGTRDDA